MLKKLMLSTALSAAMATGAFAQSPGTPSSSTPAPGAQSRWRFPRRRLKRGSASAAALWVVASSHLAARDRQAANSS
jgi:hypothetical protein